MDRYRHSREEEEDLLEFYDQNEGNISNILQWVIGSRNEDVKRFVEFYENCIKLGVLDKTDNFDQSKDKVELLPDEKKEAKVAKANLKKKKE